MNLKYWIKKLWKCLEYTAIFVGLMGGIGFVFVGFYFNTIMDDFLALIIVAWYVKNLYKTLKVRK